MGKESTIFEGRTLDDAVRKGLDALGLSRAEVMITMVEEGSGGFLGIGARPYRVKVMPRPGGPIPEPEYRSDRDARPRGGHRREEPRRGGRASREGGGRRSGTATADRGGQDARGPREARPRDVRPREDRPRSEARPRDDRPRDDRPRADRPPREGRRDEARGPEAARRDDSGREPQGRGEARPDAARRDEPRRGEPRRERSERPERADRPERTERPERIDERPAAPIARSDAPRENGAEGGRDGGRRRRRRGGRGGGAPREDRPAAGSPSSVAPPEMPYVENTEAPTPEPAYAGSGSEPRTRPVRERREEREWRPEGSGASDSPAISNEELVTMGQKLTTDFLGAMGFEATVTATAEEGRVDVKAQIASDEELLTGRKGEVRQALQHLLNRMLNRGEGTRYHLQLEINDFWAQRERELQELARSLAEEALTSQNEAVTEYLNSQERRVIHVTLRDDTRIKTYALGTGLIKRVAVAPADFPESDREEE